MSGPRTPMFGSDRRAPRRRWWRGLGVLAGLAAAIVVLGVIVGGALWGYAWLQLGGSDVAALTDDVEALGSRPSVPPEGATTVLVTLVEDRPATDPDPAPLVADPALIQIGGPRERPAVLSLSRDLPVSVAEDGSRRLARIQADGGIEELVRALEDHVDVEFDHVAEISAAALPRLAEVAGPIEACGDGSGPLGPDRTGCTELDADAMRAAIAAAMPSDLAALSRDALRSISEDLEPVSAVTSPLTTKRITDVVAEEVTTDVALRASGLTSLASAVPSAPAPRVAAVEGVVNPTTDARTFLAGSHENLFAAFTGGQPLGELANGVDEIDLDEVRVGVLNGTGTAGYAGELAQRLEQADARVRATDNATDFDHRRTTIEHAANDPEAELAAIALAEMLGGDVRIEATGDLPLVGDRNRELQVVVTGGRDLDDGDDG